MRASVQRWGNSLALRIPKAMAQDTRLTQGSEVELMVEKGRLVVAPVRQPHYVLDGLLKKVTPKNRHREVDLGGPVGREVW